MSQFAYRSVLAGAVLALIGSGALAQTRLPPARIPLAPPPADAVIGGVEGVEITAPKIVERSRIGVVTSEVSMSVRVPYGDLDMRSPTGAAELDRRVAKAANYVCDQLEDRYPEGSPETFYCAKSAIADARPQVIKARNTP
jgi:UrcA family protein